MEKKLTLPLSWEDIDDLHAGDSVLLTGYTYTGRDQAHKRLVACMDEDRPLPVDIRNAAIYYVGPAPASPGHAVGPAGPTTSYRMDAFAPRLMDSGLKVMIGKGQRNQAVKDAIIRNHCVYFAAIGGAAALLSSHIVNSEVLAYDDLGPEAIHRFELKDFPVTVAFDCHGGDLYKEGPEKYRK